MIKIYVRKNDKMVCCLLRKIKQNRITNNPNPNQA